MDPTYADSRQRNRGIDWTLIGTLGVLFFGYLLIYDIVGQDAGSQIFAHNIYDSYSLQALSWLNGKTTVDPSYTWLELAIFEGNYYVSFPPFPSVIMLPLAAIFGEETPSNLVLVFATLAAVAFAYECFRKQGTGSYAAAFWSVFYVMGSNMLGMSVFGGVWYMAQGFNLALATGALWALMCSRRGLCMALLALAIGCRPFSLCLFVGAWIYFAVEIFREEKSLKRRFWEVSRILIVPVIVACCYFAYNVARFGNPMEFGHAYLPEFTEAELGQFDPRYVAQNAHNIFLIPVTLDAAGTFHYPEFDGFMFFLANPFFIIYFVYLIRDIKRRQFDWKRGLITACFAANLLLLLTHKTFGGWQFGARYTVDLLPYALAYLLVDKAHKPNRAVVFTGTAAILFNVYGALALYFRMGY